MARNLDDLSLSRSPSEEWKPRSHIFNNPTFLLSTIGGLGLLLCILIALLLIFGKVQAAWLPCLAACGLFEGLLVRLRRSMSINIDEHKAAAEGSTSEGREKLRMLREAYGNFLGAMHINVKALEHEYRLDHTGCSEKEVRSGVQEAIEDILKDRYATIWPWEKGPTSSFKLAATRFHRAIESLERLIPTINRRDALEKVIDAGASTEKNLKDKDQLDQVVSTQLIRINGEIKEIPPLANQVVHRSYWYVSIGVFITALLFAGLPLLGTFGFIKW